MKMFRKNEGFTLVELMVVVLIIGILVAIAVPVFLNASANAQLKSCQANQRTLDGANSTYNATNNEWPTASLVTTTSPLVAGGYIKAAPKCPGVAAGDSLFYDMNDQYGVTSDALGTHAAATAYTAVKHVHY